MRVLIFAAVVVAFTACDLFTPSPRFKVGDCVMVDNERERWERTTVTRIEEVGRRGYRESFFIGGRWLIEKPSTLYFTHQNVYRIVPCPA